MNQFQHTKLEEAQDRHPLGVKSTFHSSVELGDMVGIIYKYAGGEMFDTFEIPRHPYFYEIYDNQKLLGMGGGSNLAPEKLEELITERLVEIDKNKKHTHG